MPDQYTQNQSTLTGQHIYIQMYLCATLTINSPRVSIPLGLKITVEQIPIPPHAREAIHEMEALHFQISKNMAFQTMDWQAQIFHDFGLKHAAHPPQMATPTSTTTRKRLSTQEDKDYKHRKHNENACDR